jgi:hypothetical protein
MRSERREIIKQQILEGLNGGLSRYKACENAGISLATFYRWLKQDKKFAKEVAEAEEVAVMMVEDALYVKAVKGDVRAMIFFLTNRRPNRWKVAGNELASGEEKKIVFEVVDARSEDKSNENI